MTKILKPIGFWLLVAFVILFSIFPFYYAIISSLRTGQGLFDPSIWPSSVEFANYAGVFRDVIKVWGADLPSFLWSILYSLLVAVSVVLISLFLGVTAAYALGRVQFAGRGLLLMTILAVSMFPQVAVLSGMFELVRIFGLYNQAPGLIVANLILTLPFTVWVLTTFMKELPKELEEAAFVDGASPWVVVWKVFMPLMWPAMATTGLLAFIAAWNEFLFALTFSPDNRTVPVAIASMSGASQQELPWGNIMAGSVIVTLPLIVLVLIFQRKIVAGLTAGAVKG